MKVRELIAQLNKLDPERDIWIGYDYPHEVQKPDFVLYDRAEYHFCENETRLKEGDYIHYAE